MQFEAHYSQCLKSIFHEFEWEHSVVWQAWTGKKALSSLDFILNNHLRAVNKQGMDQFSKGLVKRHLKNFNIVGLFIIKFTKQTFNI